VRQKQDIKGFSLLELLVVVVIVAVISAIGYPNFMDWRKDREVRLAAENISSMISGIVAQTQRGAFPYVQFTFGITADVDKKIFKTKGMSQKSLGSTLNSGNTLNCDIVNSGVWDDHEVHIYEAEVAVHKILSGAICFSKDGTHYGASGSYPLNPMVSVRGTDCTIDNNCSDTYIIICDLKQYDINGLSQIGTAGECNIANLQKPAYLVEWSRFGSINLFKWSGDKYNYDSNTKTYTKYENGEWTIK